MPDALPAATFPIYPAWDRLQAAQHGPIGWGLPLSDKAKPEGSRWFEFRVVLFLFIAHIGFPHWAAGD